MLLPCWHNGLPALPLPWCTALAKHCLPTFGASCSLAIAVQTALAHACLPCHVACMHDSRDAACPTTGCGGSLQSYEASHMHGLCGGGVNGVDGVDAVSGVAPDNLARQHPDSTRHPTHPTTRQGPTTRQLRTHRLNMTRPDSTRQHLTAPDSTPPDPTAPRQPISNTCFIVS